MCGAVQISGSLMLQPFCFEMSYLPLRRVHRVQVYFAMAIGKGGFSPQAMPGSCEVKK